MNKMKSRYIRVQLIRRGYNCRSCDAMIDWDGLDDRFLDTDP